MQEPQGQPWGLHAWGIGSPHASRSPFSSHGPGGSDSDSLAGSGSEPGSPMASLLGAVLRRSADMLSSHRPAGQLGRGIHRGLTPPGMHFSIGVVRYNDVHCTGDVWNACLAACPCLWKSLPFTACSHHRHRRVPARDACRHHTATVKAASPWRRAAALLKSIALRCTARLPCQAHKAVALLVVAARQQARRAVQWVVAACACDAQCSAPTACTHA